MTNSRRVADVVLKYSVDQAGVNAAQTANRQLQAGMQSLAVKQADTNRAFSAGAMDASTLTRSLQAVDMEAQQTARSLDALARPREIDIRTQRFDEVSRDVGLAGDVQSNLGAIGGLTGAAGLGGAGQGIAAAGEVVALIEELPRLKTAVQGLPATVNAAGAALGGTGAGLIGALGIAAVAIGAVAIAAQRAAKQIQEAAEDFNQVIDARVETEKLIALGDTTTAQARELAQAREAEASAVRRVQAELKAAQDGLNFFQRTLSRIADLVPGVKGLGDQIKELDSEADGLEKQAGQLNQAIEAGRFANADRKAAEEAATSAIDTSVAATSTLADSSTTLTGALDQSAASATNAAQAVSAFSLEADNINKSSFGLRNIDGSPVAGGGGGRTPSRAATAPRREAAQNIQQQIADAELKAGQARVDAATQFNRDIQQSAINNQRRLADIQRQAARDEREAARGRDFAGIISIRESASQQAADANIAAQRELDDRRTALNQRLADLNTANQREIAALRAKVAAEGQILQQGYKNALGAARNFTNSLVREFQRDVSGQVQGAVRREIGAIVGGGS